MNHIAWNPSQSDASLRPEVTWTYSYDNSGNIIQYTTDTSEIKFFEYDSLDRLVNDVFYGISYRYDFSDNRITINDNGNITDLTYFLGNNALILNGSVNIISDGRGNTLNDGKHDYVYNDFNHLTSVDGSIQYVYNAFGKRTRKVTPTSTTVYHYNLAGQLISETDQNGITLKDYIYLGKQPVAVVTGAVGQSTISYIHTDSLYTPRRITNSSGKVVWSWDSDAFGQTAADTDPDGDGVSFELNLRFTGQYFDSETGLHNSSNKYYDPNIGRYITTNTAEIGGGLNKYVYLTANPLKRADIYCLRNQHKNRKFDVYNRYINHLYNKVDKESGLFEGFLDLSITNSITSIFDEPSITCSQLSDSLISVLIRNNVDNKYKIKVDGLGLITN